MKKVLRVREREAQKKLAQGRKGPKSTKVTFEGRELRFPVRPKPWSAPGSMRGWASDEKHEEAELEHEGGAATERRLSLSGTPGSSKRRRQEGGARGGQRRRKQEGPASKGRHLRDSKATVVPLARFQNAAMRAGQLLNSRALT